MLHPFLRPERETARHPLESHGEIWPMERFCAMAEAQLDSFFFFFFERGRAGVAVVSMFRAPPSFETIRFRSMQTVFFCTIRPHSFIVFLRIYLY